MKTLLAIVLALALVAAEASAATLSWVDNSDNEEGFRVYRAQGVGGTFTEIAVVGPNVTTYTDPLGGPGFCYRVTAYNSAGESQPSNNACLLLMVPTPPTLTVAP